MNFKKTTILFCCLLMNPYMRLQRALGCKTLSTDLAGERLLACKDKDISWRTKI